MKLWVKNTILAVILVLIIAVPLLFMGGHDLAVLTTKHQTP